MINPFKTPHIFETMYVHYDQQLQRKDLPPLVRQLLTSAQRCYIDMHQLLVPFAQITKGLPIDFIKK